MPFLLKILQAPSYGYFREGALYVPTRKELFAEFFHRLNLFRDRKNWIQCLCWGSTFILVIPFILFLTKYLTPLNFLIAFIYSMVIMGTHGTIWYHRYATHRAYTFKNAFWRFITANLVIKLIPDEVYVVSHHVHHAYSEKPGDPYNVNGGWWYCFLADVNHQPIAKDLSEDEYRKVAYLLSHTGIKINTYAQYQTWGSVVHPGYAILQFTLNWAFWYAFFYLIGGQALAITIFAAAGFWGFGVRTYNFDGHGGGKDKRKEGSDFYREDHSINQLWPGLITGEWHNNHHLYPNSARAGFLWYQLDYAWDYVKLLSSFGAITSYRDHKPLFMKDHYEPYLKSKQVAPALS